MEVTGSKPFRCYSGAMSMTREQAEWAAVFLAAAELTRRGYRVSFTLGQNAPLADLVVRAPSRKAFIVDVKGKCRPGRWVVKPKIHTPDLFYILVRLSIAPIGAAPGEDRYYVLDQAEATRLTRVNTTNPALSGFSSQAASASRNAWGILPQ